MAVALVTRVGPSAEIKKNGLQFAPRAPRPAPRAL